MTDCSCHWLYGVEITNTLLALVLFGLMLFAIYFLFSKDLPRG